LFQKSFGYFAIKAFANKGKKRDLDEETKKEKILKEM